MALQFMFVSGIIVCKYKIYNYSDECVRKWHCIIIFIISMSIILIFPVKTLIYSIITPILIFSLVKIINQSKILITLGIHSNNIWLTHTFFCYYYFNKLTLIPRYSVLIVIWTLLLSLISSMILNKIKNILIGIFKSIKKWKMSMI